MAHPARRKGRPVRRARPRRITIDPFPLALFGEMYFAKVERRGYERDEKGRFKSKKPNRVAQHNRI